MRRNWQVIAESKIAFAVMIVFGLWLSTASLVVYRFDVHPFPNFAEAIWWGFSVAVTPGWGSHEPSSGLDVGVRPGDKVFVPRRTALYVTVVGTVREPGKVPWHEGLTMVDAIAEAGGTDLDAFWGKKKAVKLGPNTIRMPQGRVPSEPTC